MTVSLYPQVPNVPGVPALLRLASNSIPLPALNALNVLGIRIGNPLWGIYDSGGGLALAVDSVVEVGASEDSEVPTYPLEKGTFASYNKVAHPVTNKVRVAVGGNDATRAAFLSTLKRIKNDLNLYTIQTPETAYTNANVVHFDYHREQRHGATLLTVDIWFTEIRIQATATFSSSRSVNGSDVSQTGYVQPNAITVQQLPAINAAGVN